MSARADNRSRDGRQVDPRRPSGIAPSARPRHTAPAVRAPVAAAMSSVAAAPEVPRRVRIGMPHLDPGGLSENWLLRHAGDLHWDSISRRLGVASHDIRGEDAERLYPTVVALRARYESPLGAVCENDVLDATVEVVPCGGACAHGRVVAAVGGHRFRVELLTTFATRLPEGGLRMAMPAARLAARWTPVGLPPSIVRLARAARREEPLDDRFAGPTLNPGGVPLGEVRYEPSPYSDYNGAGLLYFASYATIADTAERHLVRKLGLADAVGLGANASAAADDWALATSTVARDVFFTDNLPIGGALVASLLSFEIDGGSDGGPAGDGGCADDAAAGAARGRGVKTRIRLRRAEDGRRMADVVTRRLFVRGGR